MANIDYIARETGKNLLRNISLTAASMVTVAVSLSLVGSALLLRQGVQNATARWEGGIEFIVFVDPEAEPAQEEAIRDALIASPAVEDWVYVTQDEAYDEFVDLFSRMPEMVEAVSPEILPPSYRVVPVTSETAAVEDLVSQYVAQPGVIRVARSTEAIEAIQAISDFLTLWGLAVAVVLLVVAVLIILTTIQLAIYTRRREIEVMRLVGASNSFIRIPFMAEGLIQGVSGAALAIGSLVVFKPIFENSLPSGDQLPLFAELTFSSVEMFGTYLFLGSVGAGIGTAAAAIAVSWFLDA